MNLEDLAVRDICRGYTKDEGAGSYRCIACGKQFHEGEVYPLEGRFFSASRAIALHMEQTHSDYLQELVEGESRYNSLTAHQQQLLLLFAQGLSDKEIAKQLEVAPSTIRHQKFMFREKAKQAKLYLAIYERVFSEKDKGESGFMPVHGNAKMVDQRYVITQEEREHILQTAFSSLEPLRLKMFSPKEKKKLVILSRIAGQFQQGTEYTEPQVNGILKEIFDDYATLRRYLIEYGFMKRTKDGATYWLA